MMLENSTWRMSAWVSVPIIIGVEEEARMQFVTRTFSTGRTGRPGEGSSASVFRQMESSVEEAARSNPGSRGYPRAHGERGGASGPRGGRPRGRGLEPEQGLLPGGRHHQARGRPLLPGGGRGRAARRGRPAQRAGPLRQRDPRRVLLPEACAREAAGLGRGRGAQLSVGAQRPRRSCPATPRPWPGWRTWAAWSSTRIPCGRRTSSIPTSCASTSTPCRGSSGRRSWRWPEWCSEVLADFGLVGWPKTSGSRGIHVNVRIHPRWSFAQVRRAALALAREVERRAPDLATSKWWKEERHGVFLDYNQNAKDRTVAERLLGAAEARRRGSRRP